MTAIINSFKQPIIKITINLFYHITSNKALFFGDKSMTKLGFFSLSLSPLDALILSGNNSYIFS